MSLTAGATGADAGNNGLFSMEDDRADRAPAGGHWDSVSKPVGGKNWARLYDAFWFIATSAVLAVVVAMAFTSAYNAHPDEKDHTGAGRYYMEYWDPPKIGDPRAMGAYSNYGVSYLNQLDAVYMLAGKFACLVNPLVGKDYLSLRLFNVGLLVMLTVLAWRLPRQYRLAFLPLYISPQAWYVFSYFNGDALPLALTFVSVYCLTHAHARPGPGQAARRGADPKVLLTLGLTLGLLSISKQNYYVYLAFFFCLWLVVACFEGKSCPVNLRQAGLVLGLALAIFGLRYASHVWVVRHQPPDAAAKVAEQIAPKEFKPSVLEKGEGFWGSRMRSKGVTLVEMFTGEWKWHVFTFRSAFGKYGGMDIEAPLLFYRYIGRVLAVFSIIMLIGLYRSGPEGRLAAAVLLLFVSLTVFQSLWHSWTSDFQAQGRYLFPILAMMGCVLVRHVDRLGRWLGGLWAAGACLWGMSLWSFVAVGLSRIPR